MKDAAEATTTKTDAGQNYLDFVYRAKGAAAEAAFGAALRETGDLDVAVAARDGALHAVRDFMLARNERNR